MMETRSSVCPKCGTPRGTCHPCATSTKPVIYRKNNQKWHSMMMKSYYYIHMIPEGTLGRNFARFKYRRLKNMKNEDEKYRIKPRKKYAKQVWIRDGKAILVEPIEKRDEEE